MTARWPRAVHRSERSSSPIFLKLTVFLPMSMLVSSSSWTTKAGLGLESAECTSLPIQKILIVWLLTWPPTPEKRLVAVSANHWAKVQGWQGPLRAPSRTVEADPGQWWHRPEQWHRCHPHRWPSSLGNSLLTEGAGIAASHGRAVDQLHLPWQVKSKPVCPKAQRILGVQCLDPSLLAIPCGFQTWWHLHRCCAQMELQGQAVNHQLGEAARCQGPCPPKLERLGAHAKYAKTTTGRSHTAKIQDLGFAKSSWHLPCRTPASSWSRILQRSRKRQPKSTLLFISSGPFTANTAEKLSYLSSSCRLSKLCSKCNLDKTRPQLRRCFVVSFDHILVAAGLLAAGKSAETLGALVKSALFWLF